MICSSNIRKHCPDGVWVTTGVIFNNMKIRGTLRRYAKKIGRASFRKIETKNYIQGTRSI